MSKMSRIEWTQSSCSHTSLDWHSWCNQLCDTVHWMHTHNFHLKRRWHFHNVRNFEAIFWQFRKKKKGKIFQKEWFSCISTSAHFKWRTVNYQSFPPKQYSHRLVSTGFKRPLVKKQIIIKKTVKGNEGFEGISHFFWIVSSDCKIILQGLKLLELTIPDIKSILL